VSNASLKSGSQPLKREHLARDHLEQDDAADSVGRLNRLMEKIATIVAMGLNTTQKMAITGVGLAATGIGLSLVGAALIAPSVFAWTAKMMQKGTDALADTAEGASRTVGTVAGTLHRSFREAAKAGIAQNRRSTYNSGE